ncbi:hypothetical protein VitviT2T_026787 [Vitis vinifera]|uniref:Uncharacterized protein n=1 Tax=Vitis vinifera TaxID=29760 RepID=A0ABY9DMU7_VITVI|nr:hypothetical protein VitviT2T_026787 [Vitis vinifera]
MVGSDHPFDERMGRLGRKGVLGHNLGLGARKRSDGVPLLKLTPSFDPYGWIRVLVHGLGFDRDFKGWMGEAWKRQLAGWFLGPSGRVLGQFFFSNRESRREDRNGGLGSSFRRTDGETREERRFGP